MTSEGAILVTGANGLIGYALAAKLASEGRRVLGMVRRLPPEPYPFEVCFADLSDIHRIHSIFTEQPIEALVHSGAVSGPMVGLDNPFMTIQTNVVGTANVLEACRVHGVKRVVYTSSTTAYGDTPPAPVGEDAPLRPTDVYGATKAAGEALVAGYSAQHDLESVSLRISWVYGPRRVTDCVIRTMITDALAGRVTVLDYGIGFYRQYVHVDDVVASIVAALDAPAFPQGVYNVTGGTYVTLDQVARTVEDVLPAARIHMGEGRDPVDTLQQEFDISAIERDLGYVPRIALKEGIQSYAEWLRDQADGVR